MIIAFVAYFLGTLPFGRLISRYYGIHDINKVGSGNVGATNVSRNCGYVAGAMTLLGDCGKGLVAAHICYIAHEQYLDFLVVIGHIWPVTTGFKGGKGIATMSGVLLYKNPYICIVYALLWIIALYRSHISAIAGVFLSIVCMINCFILRQYMLSCTCMLIIWSHRQNLHKILKRI